MAYFYLDPTDALVDYRQLIRSQPNAKMKASIAGFNLQPEVRVDVQRATCPVGAQPFRRLLSLVGE